MTNIALDRRVSLHLTEDLDSALRRAADARGQTVADYVRGSVQGRLMMDGVGFRPLPNLQRLAARTGRVRSI